MAKINKVVLVGHCNADQFSLTNAVRNALGNAVTVTSANDDDEVAVCTSAGSLMLVNRQLDGQFGVDGGIELIRQLCSQSDPPAVMLISNYADAQEQAIAAGAQRGFGKSDLADPATATLFRTVVAGS